MIASMTGVGNARKMTEDFDIKVKIRSLNSRYLDINIRMPHTFNAFEMSLRQICQNMLGRGKIDITVEIFDSRADSTKAAINEPLINAILDASESIKDHPHINADVDFTSILSLPNAMKIEPRKIEDPKAFEYLLVSVIEEAIRDLNSYRYAEGKRLEKDIIERLDQCLELLTEIESYVQDVKLEYFNKIKERISELAEKLTLDDHRLEQEAAILADRSDITEELVRFYSHIRQMRELLKSGSPIGKKLDFVVQEIYREINTLGSKSKNIRISRVVIETKSVLEKIREQVQNIE